MRLYEQQVTIPVSPEHRGLLSHAVGILSALRAGISPKSVRRPLASTLVEHKVKPAAKKRHVTAQNKAL